MGEYLDPAVMRFIGITAGIALVVALADLLMIQRHRGTVRLAGLQPAVDCVMVIAGFMAFVGTCFVIAQLLLRFATTGFGWEWDYTKVPIGTIILSSDALDTYVKEMIGTTTSIIVTWFASVILFEVWCLLRILLRRSMRKLTVE